MIRIRNRSRSRKTSRVVLGFRTVHGLLSHLWTAIVVNCLTPYY
ncbi:acid stress response protein YqgB [Klebsiella pneumoniae subsp. pneumoniae]|nr:acid stress response protein YqgB [Klebsiella pneumoniae subsp. pneumoniae]